MNELDHDLIVKIGISIGTVLVSVIVVMGVWIRTMLMLIVKSTVNELKTETKTCQAALNLRIDQIDEYGQKNREVSYQAKDGIADHVKEFHTKR